MSTRLANWLIGILVISMAIAIPVTIFLAYYTDEMRWLIVATICFIIFMAG